MVGLVSRLSGRKATAYSEDQIAGSTVSGRARSATKSSRVRTVISVDLAVAGNLESKGDIEIHGRVTGDVTGRDVLIGVTANVEGSIIADSIEVFGHVNGPVTAMTVTVRSGARIIGKITHNKITTENDTKIEGLRPWQPVQFFTG